MKARIIGLLGIHIILLAVLSTVFCCEIKAEWISSAVQVPNTQGVRVVAAIHNFADAFRIMTGRDAMPSDFTAYMGTKWGIRMAVGNSTNESVVVSLSESAVVMPDNRSWSLIDLASGKLPESIPPYSHVEGSFNLPDAALSSGSIIKLYLTWYDSEGRHGEYWSWVLEKIREPVKV